MRMAGISSLAGLFLIIGTRICRSCYPVPRTWMAKVLGILPNFGGALALSLLALTWLCHFRKNAWHPGQIRRHFLAFCVFVFSGLSLWELLQFLFWGYPMDFHDILATCAGTAAALITGLNIVHTGRPSPEKVDI